MQTIEYDQNGIPRIVSGDENDELYAAEIQADRDYYSSRGLHTDYQRRMHDAGLNESDFT